MKKLAVFLLSLLMALNCLVGCSPEKKELLPVAKVGVSGRQFAKAYALDWKIENVSKEDSNKMTFRNGKDLNYSIRNHSTGKTYTSEDYELIAYKFVSKNNTSIQAKDNSTLIIAPGEKHTKTLVIEGMEPGNYTADFSAESEEGTNPSVKYDFIIESNE